MSRQCALAAPWARTAPLGARPARSSGSWACPSWRRRRVRQPQPLRESPPSDIDAYVATLGTHRRRAIVLAMLLSGLRLAEARSLLLANVDMGRRRLRVVGTGG